MWDILITPSGDCVKATSRELISEDLILQMEYEGRRWTK